jgi:hypothetical protein
MHELEGPRRSCAPCQAAIARHRPAAPDCSTSRRPRLLVACLSRNGCPEVPGSRSLGSRSSVDCPPRSHPADRSVARPSVDVSAAVSPVRSLGRVSFDELPRVGSRSRLLGSRSCAERGAPSWPSGADRSAPAPVWSGCPADSAPITRGPPARDCPASSHPDCSGRAVAGRVLARWPAIARPSTSRNPSPISRTRVGSRSPASRHVPEVTFRTGPRSRRHRKL